MSNTIEGQSPPPTPLVGSSVRSAARRRWIAGLAVSVFCAVAGVGADGLAGAANSSSRVAQASEDAADAADTVHMVSAGEYLGLIASQYDVSAAAIASANNITNPNRIYVGQRLTIPVAGAAPTTTAPPAPAPEPAEAPTEEPVEALVDEGPAMPTAGSVLVTPTGVVMPILGTGPNGWEVKTPCQNVTVTDVGDVVSGVDVVLDPGHGGRTEPGAVGPTGVRESDMNLAVATRVQWWLTDRGISSVLTRTTDHRVSIHTRAEIAETLQPKVFLSVHHNGGQVGLSATPGTEAFYQRESKASRRLAGLIVEELRAAFGAYDIQWSSRRGAGATFMIGEDGDDYYGVLRRPQGVVSVISEAMYMNRAAEEALINDRNFRQVEAAALGRAIQRFLSTDDKGTGFVPGIKLVGSVGNGGGLDGCLDPQLK